MDDSNGDFDWTEFMPHLESWPRSPVAVAPSPSDLTDPDQDTDLPPFTMDDDESELSSVPAGFDDSSLLSVAPAFFSDSSSDLSPAPSRLNTPSPDIMRFTTPPKPKATPKKIKKCKLNPYISPPASQGSSRASPGPDSSNSSTEDGERPSKRRRLVDPLMHRETKRLDMDELQDEQHQAELDRLLKALRTKKKIVVVAGAGISVSAGIPDFRSSNGLFQSLKAQNNLKNSGKDLFSANVYRDNRATEQFHNMVRSLHKETAAAKPTAFHHLVARLAQEGRLLRLYSQNVDGIDIALPPLETQVPFPRKGPWPKTVQLHGGLSKMVCTKCSTLSNFEPELFDGPQAPECPTCHEVDFARTEIAGKRSHGVGRLRPRMVLYDESNPDDEAIGSCTKADWRRRPDCIIVVGTTLKIPGVRRIVQETCKIVRHHRDGLSVWINNDSEPPTANFEDCWDVIVRGTSDQVAQQANLGQWNEYDPGEFKPVSEEEVQQIKERGTVHVVIESPSKMNKFADALASLPSPARSVRAKSEEDAARKPAPATLKRPNWLDTVMNNSASGGKFANPASTGKPIEEILAPLPHQDGPEPPTSKPALVVVSKTKSVAITKASTVSAASKTKKASTTAAKPRAKKQEAGQNKKLDFKLAKGNQALTVPSKQENVDPVKKPKPLHASPSRENMRPLPISTATRDAKPSKRSRGAASA